MLTTGTRLPNLILNNLNNHLNSCSNQRATLADACGFGFAPFIWLESVQHLFSFGVAVRQDKVLRSERGEPTASSRHGLIAVKVDPLRAGDLHHGAVQTGVSDQPHHPLCYQRRPACRRGAESKSWQCRFKRHRFE